MAWVWHCAHCGSEWPEDGSRRGYNAALRHLMHVDPWHADHPEDPRAQDRDFALFNLDTGEQAAAGLKRAGKWAVDHGVMRPPSRGTHATPEGGGETKAGNGDERLARDLVSKADPMSGTAQAQHKGEPLALDFKGLQLHLPPYLYAYFAMGMRAMGRPETGEDYPFTAQGVADYVTDFLRYSHEVRLPQFLKLKRHEIESVEGRRALAAAIAAIEGLTGDDLAAVVRRILEAGEDQDHGEDTHGQAV